MMSHPVPKSAQSAVLLAMAVAALLIAQHVAGRALRDALFLTSFPSTDLPRAMLAAAAVGLVSVVGASRAMAQFGPGLVIPALLLASGALHGLEWQLLGQAPRAAVLVTYLHVSIIGGIAVSGFWSVVNERFDPHTVRSIASRLGVGLATGGLLGGLAARSFSSAYGLRPMLLALAASSACAALGIRGLSSGSSALETSQRQTPVPKSETSTNYLALMATLVTLTGLSSAVVDFTFKASVSARVESGPALVGFFALFYMAVSMVSVVVQLTAARWMLGRFGIGVGLASLPAAVVVLGALGMVLPATWVLVLLRGSGVVLESSLFRAAYEPLYAPLPVAQKRAKKTLIDVACDRFGEALGSGVVLVVALLGPVLASRLGLAVAVIASAAAAWVASRLERGYVGELAASLRSGRLQLDTNEIKDATTRLTLSQTQLEVDRQALLRQVEALRDAAVRAAEPKPVHQLLVALHNGEPEAINRELLAGPLQKEHASLVIPWLERDETADAVVVALRGIATKIPGQLVDALLDEQRPIKLRRRIPRVLRTAAHPRVVRGLSEALLAPEPELRARAALALRELSATTPELSPPRRVVLEAVAHELELAQEGMLSQVFTLLGFVVDREALELALRALSFDDDKLRGTALEYMEHVIPEPIRSRIWPLLRPGHRPRQATERTPSQIAAELRRSMG
jgi:ATP:ADP antiporter, AAA family